MIVYLRNGNSLSQSYDLSKLTEMQTTYCESSMMIDRKICRLIKNVLVACASLPSTPDDLAQSTSFLSILNREKRQTDNSTENDSDSDIDFKSTRMKDDTMSTFSSYLKKTCPRRNLASKCMLLFFEQIKQPTLENIGLEMINHVIEYMKRKPRQVIIKKLKAYFDVEEQEKDDILVQEAEALRTDLISRMTLADEPSQAQKIGTLTESLENFKISIFENEKRISTNEGQLNTHSQKIQKETEIDQKQDKKLLVNHLYRLMNVINAYNIYYNREEDKVYVNTISYYKDNTLTLKMHKVERVVAGILANAETLKHSDDCCFKYIDDDIVEITLDAELKHISTKKCISLGSKTLLCSPQVIQPACSIEDENCYQKVDCPSNLNQIFPSGFISTYVEEKTILGNQVLEGGWNYRLRSKVARDIMLNGKIVKLKGSNELSGNFEIEKIEYDVKAAENICDTNMFQIRYFVFSNMVIIVIYGLIFWSICIKVCCVQCRKKNRGIERENEKVKPSRNRNSPEQRVRWRKGGNPVELDPLN